MTCKVLMIDDDPGMTELLTQLLKKRGFAPFVANTGEEGIKLIHEVSPDVVILDLVMPEMDGWQVCTGIRSFSNVPILVLSVLDIPGMVTSALDAGADDYLVKPVPSSVLVAHLNTLARRASMEMGNKNHLEIHTSSLLI